MMTKRRRQKKYDAVSARDALKQTNLHDGASDNTLHLIVLIAKAMRGLADEILRLCGVTPPQAP
jgi:hypothetical protein